MRIRSGLVVAGAVLAGLLTACSGGSGEIEPTPTSPAPTATSPAPDSPSPAPPVTSSPRPTSPAPGATTLTGQVVEGVEAGCKLLQTGDGLYLLAGEAAEDLEFGGTVTVRGRERPDLLSTCQQGIPFEVTEVLD